MAHADYDCCAICDRKMSYSHDPKTKEEICSSCVADMAERGVIIHGVDEFKKWLRETAPEISLRILREVGFRKCFYGNEVDELWDTAIAKAEGKD